jgi:hypothetical protein
VLRRESAVFAGSALATAVLGLTALATAPAAAAPGCPSGNNHESFLFCVNPGSEVNKLPNTQAHRASSLLLRTRTTIPCY